MRRPESRAPRAPWHGSATKPRQRTAAPPADREAYRDRPVATSSAACAEWTITPPAASTASRLAGNRAHAASRSPASAGNRPISMRGVKRAGESSRAAAALVLPAKHARHVQVMHHDRSRMPANHLQDAPVERRISHVVQDALEGVRVGVEPVDSAPWKMLRNPRVAHVGLIGDSDDVVMLGERRQDARAVVSDARALGRQRRTNAQLRSGVHVRCARRSVRAFARMHVFERRASFGAGIPCEVRARARPCSRSDVRYASSVKACVMALAMASTDSGSNRASSHRLPPACWTCTTRSPARPPPWPRQREARNPREAKETRTGPPPGIARRALNRRSRR